MPDQILTFFEKLRYLGLKHLRAKDSQFIISNPLSLLDDLKVQWISNIIATISS